MGQKFTINIKTRRKRFFCLWPKIAQFSYYLEFLYAQLYSWFLPVFLVLQKNIAHSIICISFYHLVILFVCLLVLIGSISQRSFHTSAQKESFHMLVYMYIVFHSIDIATIDADLFVFSILLLQTVTYKCDYSCRINSKCILSSCNTCHVCEIILACLTWSNSGQHLTVKNG